MDYTTPDDAILIMTREKKPILLQFSADWCGPCRAIAPMIGRARDEYGDRVTFLKVNLDQAETLAARFGVRSIPVFLLVKGNEVADRFRETPTLTRMSAFLDRHLDEDASLDQPPYGTGS